LCISGKAPPDSQCTEKVEGKKREREGKRGEREGKRGKKREE